MSDVPPPKLKLERIAQSLDGDPPRSSSIAAVLIIVALVVAALSFVFLR